MSINRNTLIAITLIVLLILLACGTVLFLWMFSQRIQPQARSANIVPSSMTIDVDIPRCDEPFNVLINLTNTGSRTSPTGRLTLEDIRVRTGDVTHSSFANIPQINPQENSVLNVPMEASRFVGEEHELLATVGDEQFRITYILRQGSCEGDSASSNPPAQSSGRRFDPGECSIEILEPWLVYPTPQGTQTFTLQPSTYPALKVEIIDGAIWYEVNFADAGIWIPFDGGITRIGLCTP